jgi:hypothetical protein
MMETFRDRPRTRSVYEDRLRDRQSREEWQLIGEFDPVQGEVVFEQGWERAAQGWQPLEAFWR